MLEAFSSMPGTVRWVNYTVKRAVMNHIVQFAYTLWDIFPTLAPERLDKCETNTLREQKAPDWL
jgi:hypothetical protein